MRFVVTGDIGKISIEMASSTVDCESVEELGRMLKNGEVKDDQYGFPISEDQLVSIVVLG